MIKARAASRETATRYRTAVLGHSEAAARLVSELGYKRPEQWNGYIPPTCVEDCDIRGMPPTAVLNDSPRRRILLDIVDQAMGRERLRRVA